MIFLELPISVYVISDIDIIPDKLDLSSLINWVIVVNNSDGVQAGYPFDHPGNPIIWRRI